ncbi:hypothetical protein AGABI2DRAFT_205959 [Agaricus bisporus var. bisporus H97]|uniref:hypothetical protein n=1 Tax=Agaricus bisporus var. bisporus (strain H97 / ATCC MYA-4626 / FGSC 10389) TaxID=936046 RepID=UPI00029F792A|nr:hypothetical protein AGABI2DRAFT_205959 [Agaricus bisporus var. bisporus H97]EKV46602.1 hypothetical protein AGABI2DRAFT_205959 [Agaricus bisporus var. bisporus H97]
MKPNAVAENVLGTMGTICWTGQLIPQVWKIFREKKTDGLSPWLMLIWGTSSAFLGVYAILQHLNIPLQVQPQLFGFLALTNWGQCLYYSPSRQNKKRMTVLLIVGTMILVGALEVLLVFVSRPAYERGITAPAQLFGVLSVVGIGSGLLPQYWEIYKRKEVKGISYLFLSVDMLGGLLNDLSLVFAKEFDGLAAASYTLVIVMNSVVLISAAILNPRARRRRAMAGIIEDTEATTTDIITEPSTLPSLLASPSSTLEAENQGSNAEKGIEEKKADEMSMRRVVASKPLTMEAKDSLTSKLPLDTASVEIREKAVEGGEKEKRSIDLEKGPN